MSWLQLAGGYVGIWLRLHGNRVEKSCLPGDVCHPHGFVDLREVSAAEPNTVAGFVQEHTSQLA